MRLMRHILVEQYGIAEIDSHAPATTPPLTSVTPLYLDRVCYANRTRLPCTPDTAGSAHRCTCTAHCHRPDRAADTDRPAGRRSAAARARLGTGSTPGPPAEPAPLMSSSQRWRWEPLLQLAIWSLRVRPMRRIELPPLRWRCSRCALERLPCECW